MATKQSSLVPLEFSSDNGTTWKVLICRRSNTFNYDNNITEEQTDCGTDVAVGNGSFGWDFDGLIDVSPTAGQVSFKDLLGWAVAKTKVQVRQMTGTAGAEGFEAGSVYIASLRKTYATNTSIGFSGTVRGIGELDIVP